MKKIILAASAIVLSITSLVVHADTDDFDFGDDDSAYNSGGCKAPYGTDYKGLVYAADSTTVLGELRVREARGARSLPSRVTVTYSPANSKPSIQYVAKKCEIPGSFTGTYTDSNGNAKKLHFTITWNYFAGTDESGNQYLAADNGKIENIEIDPKIALIGYHTLAFEAISQTNDVDSTSLGYAAVSLNIKKTGKYSASVKMPNGWSFSASGKATSDGTNTYCKVSKARKSGGGRESVAFTIVVNNLSQAVSVADVSDWISTSKKWPINAALEFVAGGNPETTTTEYKKFEKQILGDDDQLVLKTTKLTQKSGLVSGSFYYYVPNSKGKLKRKTGKIVGVDVNGEVYGSAYASNLWSYPFEAAAPVTDDDEATDNDEAND